MTLICAVVWALKKNQALVVEKMPRQPLHIPKRDGDPCEIIEIQVAPKEGALSARDINRILEASLPAPFRRRFWWAVMDERGRLSPGGMVFDQPIAELQNGSFTFLDEKYAEGFRRLAVPSTGRRSFQVRGVLKIFASTDALRAHQNAQSPLPKKDTA